MSDPIWRLVTKTLDKLSILIGCFGWYITYDNKADNLKYSSSKAQTLCIDRTAPIVKQLYLADINIIFKNRRLIRCNVANLRRAASHCYFTCKSIWTH